jgi:hypothetical protein
MNERELQDLIGVIDSRIERAQRKQPHYEYGTIATFDTATRVAGVKLLGATAITGGFHVPASFNVDVDDYVRVMVHPNGDHFVVENLTRLRLPSIEFTSHGATPVEGHSFLVAAGATVFLDSTEIGGTGMALLGTDGNDGAGYLGWYRNGSFNFVAGGWTGISSNSMGFQGTTYTPGTTSWTWYVESNAAGARLAVKSNAGFDRNIRLLTVG